jgi:hypothetical protein
MLILQIDEPTLDAKIKQAFKDALLEMGITSQSKETGDRVKVTKKWIVENYHTCYPTVNARIKDGTLKPHRFGRKIFFYRDEIEKATESKPIKRQGIKISKS